MIGVLDRLKDPGYLGPARQYQRARLWGQGLGVLLDPLALTLVYLSAGRAFANAWHVFALAAGLSAGHSAIALLTSRRAGLRAGLVVQGFASWLADQAKGTGLALLMHLGYWAVLRYLFGVPLWWVWAGLAVPLALAVGIMLHPVLIMRLYHRLRDLEDEGLAGRLRAIAAKAGYRLTAVRVMNMSRRSRGANAMATGLGGTRRIVISDTLLERFTCGEIEAIMAHELAHHRLAHIPRGLARAVVGSLAVHWAAALTGPATAGGMYLWVRLVGAWGMLLAEPVLLWNSRRCERACDDLAVDWSSEPTAMATALARLGQQNLADPWPPRLSEWLFYSHPPIGYRVERAAARASKPDGA
ncbi:MAG: M48 family metalloprotease [Bacillota bacterium]